MKRLQRSRAKGWRMPESAVYVGRPSPWGNPFPIDGEAAPWLAVALGERADAAGRRAAAVKAYRAWMTGTPIDIPKREGDVAVLEYTDGTTRSLDEVVRGLAGMMLAATPITVPPKPDIGPLRGKDLVCWCPLDQPCHADFLLELAA